jgi:hypothetical protein
MKRSVGHPPKPESERKRNKSLRLHPRTIQQLKELSLDLDRTETDIVESAIAAQYRRKRTPGVTGG